MRGWVGMVFVATLVLAAALGLWLRYGVPGPGG